jgi:hypothetical protein
MPFPPVGAPPPNQSGLPEDGLPEDWFEREVPTEAELLGLCPDSFAGPPEGDDEWLGGLSLTELHALADEREAERASAPQDALGAGFARDLPSDPAFGFAAGGPLDGLVPDPVLAGFAAQAFEGGFDKLPDDELVGVLCAARRLESWQAAMEFTAVAELDKRRRAQAERPGSSRVHDHVTAELAAALVLTGRSADELLGMARGLARLPMVLKALAEGRIDRARAAVFVAELAALDDRLARAVAMAFINLAGRMTTGQLRAALRSMVLTIDPDAARRRAERGRQDARVEVWPEGSGNSGLAGRELPPAEAVAADARLTEIAHALKDAGVPGSIDQLRAAVFTALLTGRDPQSLIPAVGAKRTDEGLTRLTGSVNLTMPASVWLGISDTPGEVTGFGPADADTCRDLAQRLGAGPGSQWCVTLTGQDGRAVAHGCARSGPATRGYPRSRSSPGHAAGAGALAWLTSVKMQWLERDPCRHARRVGSYRPGRTLRRLVTIRHRTCAFPGCRRPARRCDADHTTPFDQGGITCECNLAPLCRQHHKTKQAQGWDLTQPQPGILVWTAPHGRSYRVLPDRYPE